MCVCACVRTNVQTNLVWQHRLQAATEVAENAAVLVDLHTLAIILDLRVHAVGALLHGIFNRLARLCLESQSAQQ